MPAPCSEGHEVTRQVCGEVPGLSVTALTSSGAGMAGDVAIYSVTSAYVVPSASETVADALVCVCRWAKRSV